jgi:hypothetical protein
MIDATVSPHGILFCAGDEAAAFVDSLRSGYARELKARATWLADYVGAMSDEAISALIAEHIGRWVVEFQGEVGPAAASR